jgi:hypothetical protein
MSGTLDKKELPKVEKRQNSLEIIKKTVEEMGGTCEIDWQTETVSINGPLPDMAYAMAIEKALAKIGAKELYDLGEGDVDVFVGEIDDPEEDKIIH